MNPAIRRHEWGMIAAIVVATCGLRLVEISSSLETDEIFSFTLSRKPFGEMIAGALADRPHPPLHILLLHGWLPLLGENSIAMRAFSVLCAGGFMLTAWALVRRVASLPFAFLALALLMLSPTFNYYGQLGRPYSLIMLLGAVNLLLFVRALERPEIRARWFAWAAMSVLLLYAQYIGALVIGFEVLVAAWVLRKRAVVPVLLAIGAGLCLLPWVLAAMHSTVATGGDPLDLIAWMPLPTSREFAMVYAAALGEGVLLGGRALMALLLLLIAAGYGLLWRRGQLDTTRALLLAVAIGVPACVFLVALVTGKPVFAQRQLIIAVFAFVLALAIALDALPRIAGWAAAAFIGLCTAITLPTGFPSGTNAPWIEITRYLDEAHAGEPIQSPDSWVTAPLQFYRRSAPVYGPTATGPTTTGEASLMMCRPHDCPMERFGTGFVEEKMWRWGSVGQRELRLYRFVPNTKRE